MEEKTETARQKDERRERKGVISPWGFNFGAAKHDERERYVYVW